MGSVIGCKQFRVAVMLFGGGSWGVVGCLVLRIARHTGPDGIYRAEQVGRTARAARHHPKERLLDRDVVLRRRMIGDLPQQHTRRQISGRLSEKTCGTTLPSMDTSPDAHSAISHEAIYTWCDTTTNPFTPETQTTNGLVTTMETTGPSRCPTWP